MKTKILAFVLACIMVISMLPTVTFAADEYKCPGENNDHTKLNCDSDIVDVVAKEDCKSGYTVRECKKCGATFATDIQPADHVWDEGQIVTTICTSLNYTKYTCTKCGETKNENIAGTNPGHEWEPTGKFDEKERPEKACKNCDTPYVYAADEYPCGTLAWYDASEATHTWYNATPTVVTAPNGATDGQATYTCDCGYTETVKIHNHKLVQVAQKDATCKESGVSVTHWACEYCNDKFATEADALIWKTTAVAFPAATNHGFGKDKLTNKHEAYADLSDANVRNQTLADCKTGTLGSEERECPDCGEWITIELEADHRPVTATTDATCMSYGYKVTTCGDCQTKISSEELPLLKHTAVTEDQIEGLEALGYSASAIAQVLWAEWVDEDGSPLDTSTERSCQTEGKLDVKCTVCNKTKTITDTALGHDVQTVTVAATCGTWGFKYQICERDDCDGRNIVTAEGGKFTVTATDGTTSDVYTYALDETGSTFHEWKPVENGIAYIAGSVTFISKENADNHRDNKDIVVAGSCTVDEQYYAICVHCGRDGGKQVTEHSGHVWFDDYTNTQNSKYTTHVDATNKEATCMADGTVRVKCVKCDTWDTATRKVEDKHTFTSATEYDSFAAAEDYHQLDTSTKDDVREGNCTVVGLTTYKCTLCKQIISIRDNTTGKHLKPADYQTAPTAAKCEIGSYWEAWTCQRSCGYSEQRVYVTAEEGTGHNFSKKITDAVAVTATAQGKYAVYQCTNANCNIAGGVWTVIDNAEGDVIYTTVNAAKAAAMNLTTYPELTARHALASNWNAVVPQVDPDCEHEGRKAYYTCVEGCCDDGKKYPNPSVDAVAFTAATIKILAVPHVYELVSSDLNNVSCLEMDYAFYHCTEGCDRQYITSFKNAAAAHTADPEFDGSAEDEAGDCTTPSRTYEKCSVCEENFWIETQAPGHKNEAGQVLTADCKNMKEITDRHCVACDTDIVAEGAYGSFGNSDWNADVDGYHDAGKVTRTYTAATCLDKESTLYFCSACGWSKMIEGEGTINHNFTIKADQSNVVELPTATTKAVVECQFNCGETAEVAGVAFSMTAANAVAGEAYTDNSLIKVTVSITGLPAANVGQLQFKVGHSTEVKFEKAEAIGANGFNVGQAGSVAGENTVNATILATGGVEVAGEAVAVMNLYFRVISSTAENVTFTLGTDGAIAAPYAAQGAADAYCVVAAESVTVELEKLMDATGDGVVDIFDIANVYQAFEASEYDVVIDLDYDGEITLNDLLLMATYVNSGCNADEYDKIVGRYVEPPVGP